RLPIVNMPSHAHPAPSGKGVDIPLDFWYSICRDKEVRLQIPLSHFCFFVKNLHIYLYCLESVFERHGILF
ncbi:MAG: hypothetical protein LUF80_03685, partial [Oscillospiraceae bacterium]|nr:hypothetical protein [Oscillospiraceae bacterium]